MSGSGPNAEGPNAGLEEAARELPGVQAGDDDFGATAVAEAWFYRHLADKAMGRPPVAVAKRFARQGWIMQLRGVDEPIRHKVIEEVIDDVAVRDDVRELVILYKFQTAPENT